MCKECDSYYNDCDCGNSPPFCHCRIGSKCPFCNHQPLTDRPSRTRQGHAYDIFPHPFLYGNSGIQRWQFFKSERPETFLIMSYDTKVFACIVCHLICSLLWTGDREGFLEGVSQEQVNKFRTTNSIPLPGATMLCKRHHEMWKDLTNRKVPGTKWPSQIIRGMVYNYFAGIAYSKRGVDVASTGIDQTQARLNNLNSQPATVQKVFPMPIFGMGWSPLGGAESITGYNFFVPMSISRPNTEVQQRVEREQNILSSWQSELKRVGKELDEQESYHALYNQMLNDLLKQYQPAFKSCLNCGQSEIQLFLSVCPFCNSTDLVTEVDPVGAVKTYKGLASADPNRSDETYNNHYHEPWRDENGKVVHMSEGDYWMFNRQNYSKAIKEYDLAIKSERNPEELAIGYCNKGQALFWSNRQKEAFAEYKLAMKLKPKNLAIYSVIGENYAEMGKFRKAHYAINQGFKIMAQVQNKNHLIYVALAYVQELEGHATKALETLNETIKKYPEWKESVCGYCENHLKTEVRIRGNRSDAGWKAVLKRFSDQHCK